MFLQQKPNISMNVE